MFGQPQFNQNANEQIFAHQEELAERLVHLLREDNLSHGLDNDPLAEGMRADIAQSIVEAKETLKHNVSDMQAFIYHLTNSGKEDVAAILKDEFQL